jgi:hypothetical protein
MIENQLDGCRYSTSIEYGELWIKKGKVRKTQD